MGGEGEGSVKIMVWGVGREWEEASGYDSGGRSTKNPMEFCSFAKVTVASALASCFTFSTLITHFLSSHTSRSFIGTKQNPLKTFQKSMQTQDCKVRAHQYRTNMGQGREVQYSARDPRI